MNEEQNGKIQDALLTYLGLDKVDTQDWNEHEETVGRTTEHISTVEESDTRILTIVEKVEVILNKNLDDLISNEIAIENALELQTLINTVIDFNSYTKDTNV